MPTQTAVFRYTTGQTITLKIGETDEDTFIASEAATERATQTGIYEAVFEDLPAGVHYAVGYIGSTPVVAGFITIVDASLDGTYPVLDSPVDAETITNLVATAASLVDTLAEATVVINNAVFRLTRLDLEVNQTVPAAPNDDWLGKKVRVVQVGHRYYGQTGTVSGTVANGYVVRLGNGVQFTAPKAALKLV